MITRGYFIGEVVDALSGIAHQVDTRCALGLMDINRFLEDFFKEVLNRLIRDANLINLNAERSNEPGLDLGDDTTGIAFQVTSQRTSAKINNTLEKLSADQLAKFDRVHVLIIGSKQKSYSLDATLCAKANFKTDHIWDLRDLSKKAMDLPIDELQRLYEYVKSEVARVNIELEIPTAEGKFPTSILDHIEAIPQPQMGDFSSYREYQISKSSSTYELELAEVLADFRLLSQRLSRLPRITREFLAFLVEKADDDGRFSTHPQLRLSFDRLKRICRYPDLDGELRILYEERFADMNPPDSHEESPYVSVFFPRAFKSDYFLFELLDYVDAKGLSIAKPLVHLDFRDF